jgi:hypothetical protein
MIEVPKFDQGEAFAVTIKERISDSSAQAGSGNHSASDIYSS